MYFTLHYLSPTMVTFLSIQTLYWSMGKLNMKLIASLVIVLHAIHVSISLGGWDMGQRVMNGSKKWIFRMLQSYLLSISRKKAQYELYFSLVVLSHLALVSLSFFELLPLFFTHSTAAVALKAHARSTQLQFSLPCRYSRVFTSSMAAGASAPDSSMLLAQHMRQGRPAPTYYESDDFQHPP